MFHFLPLPPPSFSFCHRDAQRPSKEEIFRVLILIQESILHQEDICATFIVRSLQDQILSTRSLML
ncbi:hypothetical protein JHK82_056436 [Glycine max]|uniref:Uncharacterized protein n=1 Tax=Glycine max TaxID=3847 RepID=A0A0R0ENA7_SOYBN|nr:hypothetical protein JHK86_056268 [Glycine max]KAG4918994.1 hypothetical protein JHK85_057275 [Glycine max]KAG5075078.1 hypothetical protein JHK84_056309 [Glycine max]KAG5077741.1 hypothetical protein JHK82_056436 [Glycine max]KAH1036148.1 hypothetical protein GYH30_055889 [Glycine max]